MFIYDDIRFKLNNSKPQLEELRAALDLDKGAEEIAKLEEASAAPDFWDDPSSSQKVLQKIKQLKDKAENYAKLLGQFEDTLTMIEMAEEMEDESLFPEVQEGYQAFTEELERQTLTTLLTGEYDKSNVIMSVHAGAGGTEAQDWTSMLVRMYTQWADSKGYKWKMLDYLDGEEAGIKSAELLIEGENAFGYLKSEMGVHRLVRVSPFDASGRRQTSFAAVEVMPDIDENVEVDIRTEDLRVDTYRSSGAGGQHVNKTESAIRITHLPTGIVVACQTERSQHQNREYAMRMLRSKLVELQMQQHAEKISDIKGVQMKIEWGSQIRSYVFMPYTLAKDHRTGFENGNISAVMDGDIDGFINAYLKCSATGNWAKQV